MRPLSVDSYTQIDQQIADWVERHSLILQTEPSNGREARWVWLSSEDGECFQIWIDPPAHGLVFVYAGGVDSWNDCESPEDWAVPVDEIGATLDDAYKLVVDWMKTSKHFHPKFQR